MNCTRLGKQEKLKFLTSSVLLLQNYVQFVGTRCMKHFIQIQVKILSKGRGKGKVWVEA